MGSKIKRQTLFQACHNRIIRADGKINYTDTSKTHLYLSVGNKYKINYPDNKDNY